MKISIIKKQKTFVYIGSAAGVAFLVWAACLLTIKSNHAVGSVLSGGDKDDNGGHDMADRFSSFQVNGSSSDAAIYGVAGEPELDHGSEAGNKEEIAAVDQDFDGIDDPEDAVARKERLMREQFGVIFRRGKWIPTVGGGTNLVYITNGSLPPGRVGELYDVQFQATSGFPPYTWSIAGGELPWSFSFDPRSGRISGIPLEPITTNFFLEVSDSRGARDVAEYVMVFQPEQSLEIVTENLPSAFPGEEYFVQIEARGGVPPYSWNAAGNLDEVGTLAFDYQTGLLHGEIFESSPQVDVSLVFWLSDAQFNISKELVLHVRNKLSILDVLPLSVRQSEPFELAFRATGGIEPYVWGISGSLPYGLRLSEAGLCSGEPSEPGFYEISLWVQDDAGQVDAARFTMEVLPVPGDSVSGFEALLSRNSVALSWKMPERRDDISVRVVRSSGEKPLTSADGTTVYHGTATLYLDRDVGEGVHYYAAFIEENGVAVTSAPPQMLQAKLPPDVDPFADAVVSADLLHPNAFRSADLPDIVLGPPRGGGLSRGSLNVVSLGAATNDDDGMSAPYGGSITLEFVDNVVWNGPGVDFTIFENVFYISGDDGAPDPETRFMEPAVVSVSQDGMTWRQFKFDFSPRYHPETGRLNLRHPYCYNSGFAGINPVMSNGLEPDPTDPEVSGGDSFDLSDVGLDWIRYVRIQSTGNRWLFDADGDLVYHTEDFGSASRSVNSSGFDLDAVTAIWMKKVECQ